MSRLANGRGGILTRSYLVPEPVCHPSWNAASHHSYDDGGRHGGDDVKKINDKEKPYLRQILSTGTGDHAWASLAVRKMTWQMPRLGREVLGGSRC